DKVHGESSFFVWANRGKQSLAADIKTAEGQHIVGKILENADILIQNLAPGVMQRMGMDFDSLHEKYPRLIVCDISGYG
ncbi:CoA transferase, partial [Klebsiella pneumoniae]|uniref:CoA transferase n=2 Tax=Pseudomonadota TaxID=1224 RepID=UPI0027312210